MHSDRLRYGVADIFARLRSGLWGIHENHLPSIRRRPPYILFGDWQFQLLSRSRPSRRSPPQNDFDIDQKGAEIQFVSFCACRCSPFTHAKMGCNFQIECNHFGFGSMLQSIVVFFSPFLLFVCFRIAAVVTSLVTLDSRDSTKFSFCCQRRECI